MIIEVPITGKLLEYDEKTDTGVGDKNNEVRPINFDKLFPGIAFKWAIRGFYFKKGTALVNIAYEKCIIITEYDNTQTPREPLAWRSEKESDFLIRQLASNQAIWKILISTSFDEMYKLTGEPKLEMPKCQSSKPS